MLKDIEPKRDKQGSTQRTSLPTLPSGISKKQSHYAQELADHREVIEEVIEQAKRTIKDPFETGLSEI